MSKDTNFVPGNQLPSKFLNEDQEADTGLLWGGSLGQTTANTVTLNVAEAELQVAAVIGGKKRWNTAPVSGTAVGGAGVKKIYLVGDESPGTGISLELVASPGTSSAPLNRLIGTGYYDGTTNFTQIQLRHGVQAEADQYNSFVFRSIATGIGETPVTIRGYDGQANSNTKLFRLGAGTASFVERFFITGLGTNGYVLDASTTNVMQAAVTGDSGQRFQMNAAGKMTWATGAGASPATLERTSSGTLKLVDTLDLVTLTNTTSTNIEVANHINLAATKTYKIDGTALASTHLTDTAALARLASPALTGTPTAPTAAVDTNTTQIATTAFVVGQGYLKTGTASSTYAPLASPALTGVPTAPTAAVGTSTTQIATTAFVVGQGYAKLASPTFSGTPSLPTGTTGITQTAGTNNTSLATTAFVTTATTNLFATILAANNTWAGTNAFSSAVTHNAGVTISAANTLTVGPSASTTATLAASGLTFSTTAGAYSTVSTSAFGLGTSGSADWTLTRTGVGIVELGASDKIRDTSDPSHANDLSRKSYVDVEVAKVGTKVRSTTTATDTGVTTAHDTVFVNYAGAVTITLSSYSAVGNTGKTITFKDISGNCSPVNTITIDANSSETIDGAATYVMNTSYEWVTIQSNGTNWFVVG